MKHRVQQIITFEIEIGDTPIDEAIVEEEADAIVEEAVPRMIASHARLDAYGQLLDDPRLGPVKVRFVECKAEPLTQLNEDRRLLRELVEKLQVQSAVLESFIHQELPGALGAFSSVLDPELPGLKDGVEVLVRSGRTPKRKEN